jgi:hypothetical protein
VEVDALKRAANALAVLTVLLLPAVAAACPQCAGRQDGNIVRTLILGAFVTPAHARRSSSASYVQRAESWAAPASDIRST